MTLTLGVGCTGVNQRNNPYIPWRSSVPSRTPRVLAPYTGSSCDRRWPCMVMIASFWNGSSSVPIYEKLRKRVIALLVDIQRRLQCLQ